MRRLPIVPTILVALAVAAMIGLGFWQLARLREKEALLRRYAANARLPELVLSRVPVGDDLLFRRASAVCLTPAGWRRMAGRDRAGNGGWRQIARCATGAEGPGLAVQLGISDQADWQPTWPGGAVHGFISQAPSSVPAILSIVGGGAPKELMLIADTPPPGLRANAAADLLSVPNNHLAYAVQWFLFAAIAATIYVLALRARWRKPVVPPSRGG